MNTCAKTVGGWALVAPAFRPTSLPLSPIERTERSRYGNCARLRDGLRQQGAKRRRICVMNAFRKYGTVRQMCAFDAQPREMTDGVYGVTCIVQTTRLTKYNLSASAQNPFQKMRDKAF